MYSGLSFLLLVGAIATAPRVIAEPVTEEVSEVEAEEPALTEEELAEKEKAEAEAEKKAAEEAERKRIEEEEKAAKELAEKKANAEPIPFKQIDKNPDRYAGEYVKYRGEIIQIMESEDSTVIRLAVTKTSYGYDYNDVIYVEYGDWTEFVEEDVVTVYGTIYGSYTYTSQAGYEISLPSLIADEVTN